MINTHTALIITNQLKCKIRCKPPQKKIITGTILKIGIDFNCRGFANQNAVCFICNIRFANIEVRRLVLGKKKLGAKYTNGD